MRGQGADKIYISDYVKCWSIRGAVVSRAILILTINRYSFKSCIRISILSRSLDSSTLLQMWRRTY
jgi:hypothetical protein